MKKINEYRLVVKGIFGRNRKEKFETFTIAEIDQNDFLTEENLRELAEAKIKEIKLKSGRVKVSKTPVTIENSNGFTIRSMEIALGVNNTVLDLGTI